MNDARQAPGGQHGPPGSAETLAGFSDWHEIGRGGDATVYRAMQDGLQREVAIKVLMVDDAESVRRFTREVQLMVALGRQHPNIAKVLQIGTSSLGRPCIVMDYYELGSLDRRLANEGPLPAEDVAHVGTVVADALAFAHQKGVLHRDIKPQNILMMPTSYVLADFGIARLIDQAHTASSDRFSYRHASPQVLDGETPSELDDVFSLGATLYHLLDGQPPFTLPGQRDTALSYIKRVLELPPRALNRDDIPYSLRQIVEIALQKDPARRFQSAAEMRDALADARRDCRGVAPAPGTGTWTLASGASPSAPPPAPGPGSTPSPALAHGADDTWATGTARTEPVRQEGNERRPPVVAFALTGIIVGVVVVVLLYFLTNLSGEGTDPAPPPSESPNSAPQTPKPGLSPGEIEIVPNEAGVLVRWAAPPEPVVGYRVGYVVDGDTQGTVNVPGEVTETNLSEPPEGSKICVVVIPFNGTAEFGAGQTCIDR